MKNKDKLRKDLLQRLTWGYFWAQKIDEILKFLTVCGLILLLPIIAFSLLQSFSPDVSNVLILGVTGSLSTDIGFWSTWAVGLVFIILLSLHVAALILLIHIFYLATKAWLISNWKLAEHRAKKELKIRCKVEKK